jgi:hypothetical protein
VDSRGGGRGDPPFANVRSRPDEPCYREAGHDEHDRGETSEPGESSSKVVLLAGKDLRRNANERPDDPAHDGCTNDNRNREVYECGFNENYVMPMPKHKGYIKR